MDWPLTITSMVDYAGRYHGTQEIVTRTIEGPIHRYTFADLRLRALKLGQALSTLGVGLGDRIGSLAFNTYRHLEMFHGVTGIGAVLHTVNPRLFPEQIVYIVDHAEDSWMFADLACWPIIEALADKLPNVKPDDFMDCTQKIYQDRVQILSQYIFNVSEQILSELH
jgi:fatty-acyl-CoA synthase